MNRRIARYVRVSRSEQNPDLQLDETARVVAARGWQLVDTYTRCQWQPRPASRA